MLLNLICITNLSLFVFQIIFQGESLELSQVLNNGNLAAILPSEKDPNLFR